MAYRFKKNLKNIEQTDKRTNGRSDFIMPQILLGGIKSEIVYKIPCKICEQVYIGETGRKFGTRLKEHTKDVEANKKGAYTRSSRSESLTEMNKSAITDHVNKHNHEIDWEGARVIDRESEYKTRVIKEAIHIRMSKEVMHRDEGAHQLSRVYDQVFATVTESGGNQRA